MGKNIANERDLYVVKANELIQKSRFDLSLQQQKIVLYLISKLHYLDEDFKLYEFKIQDFCRICGIDYANGKNYLDLKKSIKAIADKSVYVKIDDETETLVRWIDKPYINKGKGIIKIKLDNDMKPFLLQLKKQYTQYELIYTLNSQSKYTIRLYELIKSIHFNELKPYSSKEYSVEELKTLLGAEIYANTKDFNSRALNVAVKEINEKSDKNILVEQIKEGRTITHFKFIVSTKNNEERLKIRIQVEQEFGMELNQMNLFD